MDLPTGVSRLKTRDLPAIQDEDLVALQRFGEGFDVNPTVIVYHNFGDWGLGGGIGYLWTGEYDPTEDIPNDDFDPGDELTVSVLGDVFLGDVWRLIGRATYTHFTTDERGGIEIFREGDEIDLGVSLEWRPEPWWAVVSLRDIYHFKSDRLNAAGQLGEELQNSLGNEIRGSRDGRLHHRRHLDGPGHRWTSGTWPPTTTPTNDPLYDGGRFKIAVGPGVTWTLQPDVRARRERPLVLPRRGAQPDLPGGREDQRRARGHARDVPLLAGIAGAPRGPSWRRLGRSGACGGPGRPSRSCWWRWRSCRPAATAARAPGRAPAARSS